MIALSPDDDTSPQADLRRAIRIVERERLGGIGLAAILVLVGLVREGHTYTAAAEYLLAAILAVLCFAHAQLCGLRIDAFKRELRGLPTRYPGP